MWNFIWLLVGIVSADIYMHNPRGSNNRLDEKGRARDNANRMFDSQNNDRGGYNVGNMYFYRGSKLSIEWTNQHSCNNPNNHCEHIIQYMCGENVRDGSTVSTIPENPSQCARYDCNNDLKYGMNENFEHYLKCRLRNRNGGLFTADQKVGPKAKNTRQNPNGRRRGYECPEERDYYPYWHPSPWRDVAVLTNDARRCPYYETESENVKGRYYCFIPETVLRQNMYKGLSIPNNEDDCKNFRWPKNDRTNGVRGVWTLAPSHGIPAPECRETEFTRDNHLGNTIGGNPSTYNWTVPNIESKHCVLRIRYNISTAEFDGWDGSTNSTLNKAKRGVASQLDLSERYGLQKTDAEKRGYLFKNNPSVQIFAGIAPLQLAINTAQYGRTFQDRSHAFAIKKRPDDLEGKTIRNVNVRGKRGNIVQVYPAVEYDYVPNTLEIAAGEYVHFQWTGSNTNPNNNDGQGLAGTDRSNVVLQRVQAYPEGDAGRKANTFGHWGRSYPAHLDNATFLDMTRKEQTKLAFLKDHQFGGELSELDDAGTYFDLGPKKVTSTGTSYFMCTRNNNFSNRSQKGKIISVPFVSEYSSIGWNGGTMTIGDRAYIQVPRGAFVFLQKMRLEEWTPAVGEKKIAEMGRQKPYGNDYASNFIVIHPQTKLTASGKTFNVKMKLTGSENNVAIYRTNADNFATWTRIDAQIQNQEANFAVSEGGVYIARLQSPVGLIVGIVVSLLVVLLIVVGTTCYLRRYPAKWVAIKSRASSFQRSFQTRI
ncbi:protein DD3-3-like [Tubulanus polymorphus]|uniref:protein DD3-3-like n=1 Tax=Tubulanus polymorphus TaxID=672921 RepID=UPI003DA1FFAE